MCIPNRIPSYVEPNEEEHIINMLGYLEDDAWTVCADARDIRLRFSKLRRQKDEKAAAVA